MFTVMHAVVPDSYLVYVQWGICLQLHVALECWDGGRVWALLQRGRVQRARSGVAESGNAREGIGSGGVRGSGVWLRWYACALWLDWN